MEEEGWQKLQLQLEGQHTPRHIHPIEEQGDLDLQPPGTHNIKH